MSFVNKTAAYFYKLAVVNFFCGWPNFWIEDQKMSKPFIKIYRGITELLNFMVYVLIAFELGAFYTQDNLSKKQESDLLIYAVSHPILISYYVVLCKHDENIKKFITDVLRLKSVYNDEVVEEQMLKKSKQHSAALAFTCVISLVLHSTSALMLVIKSEGTFTTLITAWPLVDDPSSTANFVRIVINILWWVFISRIIGSFILAISLTTCISFQYNNLQSYFYSLNDIFESDNLSQREKERKYEEGFKVGVKLHSESMDCIDLWKKICNGVFSGQIVFVIFTLSFIMTQMVKSERTLVNAFATAVTASSVLFSTGFFFWNAGDVTVEAAKLPTAMYSSGWHNCRGKRSVAIRKLVVIAMNQAQMPMVLQGLGIMDLSYQSYISLVKSSYSIFSVLY